MEQLKKIICDKKFKRCFIGIREEEVYEWLHEITYDFERLLASQKSYYEALVKEREHAYLVLKKKKENKR